MKISKGHCEQNMHAFAKFPRFLTLFNYYFVCSLITASAPALIKLISSPPVWWSSKSATNTHVIQFSCSDEVNYFSYNINNRFVFTTDLHVISWCLTQRKHTTKLYFSHFILHLLLKSDRHGHPLSCNTVYSISSQASQHPVTIKKSLLAAVSFSECITPHPSAISAFSVIIRTKTPRTKEKKF